MYETWVYFFECRYVTNKHFIFFFWLGGLERNLAQLDRVNGTERPHSVAESPDTPLSLFG